VLPASAPISAEILGFVRVAFCCEVIEAYGQTEGSGAATNTNPGEKEAGHVGPPNACSEMKLVDVPELSYFATDKPYPRGEICVRGPGIIPGYLKDEVKTRETIDEEGWLQSGDIGIIGGNGTITVIGNEMPASSVLLPYNPAQKMALIFNRFLLCLLKTARRMCSRYTHSRILATCT